MCMFNHNFCQPKHRQQILFGICVHLTIYFTFKNAMYNDSKYDTVDIKLQVPPLKPPKVPQFAF